MTTANVGADTYLYDDNNNNIIYKRRRTVHVSSWRKGCAAEAGALCVPNKGRYFSELAVSDGHCSFGRRRFLHLSHHCVPARSTAPI